VRGFGSENEEESPVGKSNFAGKRASSMAYKFVRIMIINSSYIF
jgi:hypothetical protein